MKLNKRFYIQMLVASLLILSWCIYEYFQDDRAEYQEIITHNRSHRRTDEIINRSSDNLIASAEHIAKKSSSQKHLMHIMKNFQTTISDFYTKIGEVEGDFFEYDYEEIEKSKFDKPRYSLPIDYNSTKPVRLVFKETDALDILEENWKNTLIQLKKLYSGSLINSLDTNVLSEVERNDYYKKQALAIKENTPSLTQFIKKKELHSIINKYDVVHANALFSILQHELRILEWTLLKNTIQLMSVQEDNIKPIIMMETKETPQVGKTTHFQFFTSSYIAMDDMEIRINGKLYKTKDGIATLNYTPKSAGMKYFRVDISLKNPFTGKISKFSKTIKKEVFK